MTPLQQLQFAAKIQIGSEIKGYGMVLIVTKISDKYITGYSKEQFEKTGKNVVLILNYSTIMNPHYNKNLSII